MDIPTDPINEVTHVIHSGSLRVVALLLAFVMAAACGRPLLASQKQSGNFLDVGGGKIYYEECGSGPAVVLLHDGLLSSSTWDGEWSALCSKFHVIRYDRRGYGRSDAPTKPFLQADDLRALLSHLNIQRATVVGCSSGGGHAIDFTLVHPEMVERLILIGSVLHGMTVTSQFTDRGNRNNARVAKGDLKAAALNWSRDPYTISAGHDAARKHFYDALMQYPQSLKYTGEFEIRFLRPAVIRLSEIHVPTLILDGEFDMPDVQAFGGAIQAGIPGARREIVKDSAHLIPVEQPEYLSNRITSFIDDHPVVSVPANVLQTYAGQYDLFGKTTIAFRDGLLYLQVPGEKEIPLFPESESKMKCFMWTQDAEIEFVKDAAGNVTEAVIHAEDGTVTKCPRSRS